HQAAERAVVEEKRAQRLTVDGDVAQGRGGGSGHERGLSGQEVHLAEESGRAVTGDLVAGCVEHADLAFADRDERVALVADAVQDVTCRGGALLTELGERGKLGCRQRWAVRGGGHSASIHVRS